MPQDKRELGHLFPFLTQFEERGFARVLAEQIGDEVEGSTVVFRHVLQAILLDMVSNRSAHASSDIVVGAC